LTGIFFFAATGWYGAVLCIEEKMQMASSLPISMAWMYLVFPLTGAVAILHLLVHIENLFRFGVPVVSAEGEGAS
jgi:TRAP-type C4-dicarboxylate transport system permease small subunit